MRRIGAMLGIVIIVGLVCILMWRVYLHHRQSGDESDEPGVIAVLANPPVVACPLL
jgi:hypothetical protein